MNDKLPPEVRVKVAEECAGRPAKADGPHIISGNRHWQPHFVCEQKSALTRTAARLIEQKDISLAMKRAKGMDDSVFNKEYAEVVRLYASLGISLANDSVDDLERLVAELKGFV